MGMLLITTSVPKAGYLGYMYGWLSLSPNHHKDKIESTTCIPLASPGVK
jgi:hypothetical protein